jgi:hypothetical protein
MRNRKKMDKKIKSKSKERCVFDTRNKTIKSKSEEGCCAPLIE